MDDWLTVQQVAKKLGIWPTLVRRYAQAGRLRAKKLADVWVFRPEDVEAFMLQARRPGRRRGGDDEGPPPAGDAP